MSSQRNNTGIIAWFAANPVAANLLMVAILVLGWMSLTQLRVEGFPSFDPRTITIDVTYNSGSPKQAEEGITVKIEEALQGVPGIKQIRSTSTADGSSVVVERVSGYSLDKLNQDVKNKVDGIFGFPAGAEKAIINPELWEEHALWINVYGNLGQHELQRASRELEQALLRLPSINKVNKTGWRNPEISIEVDETRLQAYNLTLDQVAKAVGNESLNETSGELRSAQGRILLKADQQRYQQRDFANILLRVTDNGSEIRLKDVALVVDGFVESPNVLSRFQGQPSINLQVIVDKQADILAIAADTKALVQQWKTEERLPHGLDVAVWWDQSQFMTERLSLLAKNGAVGIVLVMVVLAIFLNLQVAFWVGMGLPICFAGAMILMGESFFNLTLNDLTTFGFIIVLGILVDDAVVVGESVYSARQQHGDSLNSTVLGVKRIAVPTMFGVLTTVAAFYPMSYISGELGKIFSQFALVAVACLLFSMLESKLILPAHLSHIRTQRQRDRVSFPPALWLNRLQHQADRLMNWINYDLYQPLLTRLLKIRKTVCVLFVSLFILVVGMIPSGQVGFVFFPDIPRDIIDVNFSARSGAGYEVTHNQARRIESIVAQLNQQWVDSGAESQPVVSNVQSQVTDDANGNVVLQLIPADQRQIKVNQVAEALRQAIGLPEGIRQMKVVTDFVEMDAFELRLLASDANSLEAINQRVINELQAIPGVSDIQSDYTPGQPQLEFELNQQGRALGLTTAALAQQIGQGFYGAEVQRIQRGKDEVKVFVRYRAQDRRDTSNLAQARIRTPSGQVVPLSAVTEVKPVYTVNELKRVNGRLAATLTANVDKNTLSPSALMSVLERGVLQQLQQQYPQLQVISGGESAEQDETLGSMINVFVLSLMLIYMLVAIPLKSYSQPLIIMSAIPFGVVGAILGHWISDLPISILSLNGILALSGVVVNDSLLLVSRYNDLKQQGVSVTEGLVGAGSQRIRAILLTSLTTYAGLASLLYESSEQAQYLIPAAASLGYGILFATVISLILVPVLLALKEDIKMWIKDNFSRTHTPSEREVNHVS